jgi:hypothetical protein
MLVKVNDLWAGLGYYRRAKYLHSGAQHVVTELGGSFPTSSVELQKIPGGIATTADSILGQWHGCWAIHLYVHPSDDLGQGMVSPSATGTRHLRLIPQALVLTLGQPSRPLLVESVQRLSTPM